MLAPVICATTSNVTGSGGGCRTACFAETRDIYCAIYAEHSRSTFAIVQGFQPVVGGPPGVGGELSAVLTNGHTGHVPRAPGFFPFEGPQLAVVKYFLN